MDTVPIIVLTVVIMVSVVVTSVAAIAAPKRKMEEVDGQLSQVNDTLLAQRRAKGNAVSVQGDARGGERHRASFREAVGRTVVPSQIPIGRRGWTYMQDGITAPQEPPDSIAASGRGVWVISADDDEPVDERLTSLAMPYVTGTQREPTR